MFIFSLLFFILIHVLSYQVPLEWASIDEKAVIIIGCLPDLQVPNGLFKVSIISIGARQSFDFQLEPPSICSILDV